MLRRPPSSPPPSTLFPYTPLFRSALFLEAIRDPETFRRAALRAARAGKAIVVLKVGSSELSARSAAAHTGPLVGDDSVIHAMFDELGIIRVDTIEDMMNTAGSVAHPGPLPSHGVGIRSFPGGAGAILHRKDRVKGKS